VRSRGGRDAGTAAREVETAECDEQAPVVVEEWLRYVELVGRRVAEGVFEVRRGEPARTAAVMSDVAAAASASSARLHRAARDIIDPELREMATALAADYTRLAGFAARVARTDGPTDEAAYRRELTPVIDGTDLDSRRLGGWLSIHCPDLASQALRTIELRRLPRTR